MSTPVQCVAVDGDGTPVGVVEKLAAHRPPGTWHLAFSVVLVDARGRVLVQRRSHDKHHFRGRWSNSCCSHPPPGRSAVCSAWLCARVELGLEPDCLHAVGAFWYEAEDPASGLVEREYDTVVVGRVSQVPHPDPRQVAEVAWWTVAEIERVAAADPASVTPWLLPVLDVASRPAGPGPAGVAAACTCGRCDRRCACPPGPSGSFRPLVVPGAPTGPPPAPAPTAGPTSPPFVRPPEELHP